MNGSVKGLKCKVSVSGEYYFFTISGEKVINGNEKLEGLSNREDGYFSFEIKVPNSQILLAENRNKKSKEENILITKKKLNRKQNKILKLVIEICESASERTSKNEAQANWSSLIKMYYELINDIKSNILNKNVFLFLRS